MIVKLMLRFSLLFIVCLFVGTSNTLGESLPESERTVIALFGDSITVGENLNLTNRPIPAGSTSHDGCPSVYLSGLLTNEPERLSDVNCPTEELSAPIYNGNNEVRNAIVANWGIGGSSTGFGSRRLLNSLLDTKSQLAGNNYIVLIMYGTNDLNFGISSQTTAENIDAMISTARSSFVGFTPIIGAVTPRDDRPSSGPSSIQSLNAQIRSVASMRNAPYVDHFANFVNFPGSFNAVLDQEQFGSQLVRLHPNDQGYLLIAEAWFEQQLKNLIPVVQIIDEEREVILSPIISFLLDD